MSGRGNNNNNNRGRGSGRNNNRNNNGKRSYNNNSNNNNSQSGEKKFLPHYSRKKQIVTYDTVRDHIEQQIQKSFKYGSDIVKAIREMKYDDTCLGGGKPTRKVITLPSDKVTREELHMSLHIEQEGFDIEYKEELRKYNIRKDVYEENKTKAYALIFS